MSMLSPFLLTDVLISVLLLFFIAIGYCKWKYQYWRRKNVPFLEPTFPFGNVPNLFNIKEHMGIIAAKHYVTMKQKGWKYGGIYLMTMPVFIPIDPAYVKNILTKDFQYFSDRGFYHNEKYEPISDHLFLMHGTTKWKTMRAKLTPTFTSNRMKMMFQTFLDCLDGLLVKINESDKNTFDIKDLTESLTLDIIGSCAFGLDLSTLKKEDSPFKVYGKKQFQTSTARTLRRIFSTAFPKLAKEIGVPTVPKDVADFFVGVVENTVKHRETYNYSRQDFMQLLVDMKNQEGALTMQEISAQCFVFFLAGFETSSTVISYALYELAKHDDVRKRLREEVDAVLAKHGYKLTYRALQEMPYLGQVIDETLRKYPVAPFLLRKCTKDYTLPEGNIVIEKGTFVAVPLLGLHYDEEYFPDPKVFNPENFSTANKQNVKQYTYLPFGEGPRNCIGLRFGLMQTKAAIATLLHHYELTINEKTVEPLTVRPNSFILESQYKIWLNLHRI